MFGKTQLLVQQPGSRLAKLLLGGSLMIVTGWFGINPALAYDPEQLEQLLRTRSCPGCDLSYANLAGRNLEGADLSGANLNAANLRRVRLEGANLTGANLNLAQTNLSGATLVLTRLESASLVNANLQNAILGGRDRLSGVASLEGTTLPTGRPATWR
jgi:hypothetical protein